ncbi:unnamed protein product [Anisakis simplex]|uniref:G_PROTEIN_RECEP_F1_2 domain-containing protein n=1 Tax=Anisakis simplex TaxID=6269 RepID=A0A0M3JB35_ANISI|nr:unnamed protein product [Anisakis simplex]
MNATEYDHQINFTAIHIDNLVDDSNLSYLIASTSAIIPHNAIVMPNGLIVMHYVYILQGSILMITNALLAITILKHYVLRQRYLIQLFQICVDVSSGFALTSAGLGRLVVTYIHQNRLRSSRFCMFMPWNIIAVWSEPLTSLCLLMVSTDRLLALIIPSVYLRRSVQFQLFQVLKEFLKLI